MSFAATTALVAVFNGFRDRHWPIPRWLKGTSSVLVASAVSGFATAPIAAAHFNVMSHYGLVANLLSVPVMGTLVVPASVLAVLLAPFGLEQLGLWLMGLGLWWILQVAEYTAALPGARSFIIGPNALVLPLMTLGALFVVIWQGRGRWAGLAPMAAALMLWGQGDRPDVLISDTGGIVGIMTDHGRALSRPKGSGFIAQNWLENDGDGVEQALAYDRWMLSWAEKGRAVHGAVHITHITGKRAAANPPACGGGVLVSNIDLQTTMTNCLTFDPAELRHTGAVGLSWTQNGALKITTARQLAGERLWSQWPENRDGQRDQYVRINPTSLP
jgi:competence protein ComEC